MNRKAKIFTLCKEGKASKIFEVRLLQINHVLFFWDTFLLQNFHLTIIFTFRIPPNSMNPFLQFFNILFCILLSNNEDLDWTSECYCFICKEVIMVSTSNVICPQ